jgi:phosphopantetheinyl transferase
MSNVEFLRCIHPSISISLSLSHCYHLLDFLQLHMHIRNSNTLYILHPPYDFHGIFWYIWTLGLGLALE